jgi:hypothetical protein
VYHEDMKNETAKNQKKAIISIQALNTQESTLRSRLGGACLLDCKETANVRNNKF